MRASGHDLLDNFDRVEARPFINRTLLEIGVPERDLITATSGDRVIHFLAE
jgi:hypothetical protein